MGFSLPGMVTPTVDVDEIGKRIADLKAVEGWLKTNLNMLQMTIQGLEMQRVALMTVQAMGQSVRAAMDAGEQGTATAAADSAGAANPFAQVALDTMMNPALWPWNFMQQPAAGNEAGAAGSTDGPAAKPKPAARRKAGKK
ncbi:PhaM family polyhydroxyalkanoate granule multifunctional regulatory protein [Sterolibacterium denitrificans]|nr:PhaM family polyhydroxyalkanoate granule multifunctional regulatory protein [Sterolibacterium denitrificans]